MLRALISLVSVLALLVVASGATAGARNPRLMDEFYSFQLTDTESIPAFGYFAKAGSLTAVAGSSIGYATYLRVENTGVVPVTLRVYGPHGTSGSGGPTGTYSVVTLYKVSAGHEADLFVSPPGMRIFGVLQANSCSTNVVRYDYGK